MKKIVLICTVFILMSSLCFAKTPIVDITRYTPLGCEQETALSPATQLSGGVVPTGATVVLFQAEDQNIRWRDDGTNPTASVGMRLMAGESFLYTGDLKVLRLIEEAASAKVNTCYYKK